MTDLFHRALFGAVDAAARRMANPAPCRCGRLPFPHRGAWQCDEYRHERGLESRDPDRLRDDWQDRQMTDEEERRREWADDRRAEAAEANRGRG